MSLRTGSECLHTFSTVASSLGTVVFNILAVPNQKIYLYRMIITIGSPAVTVQLTDFPAGPLSQPFNLGANGAITLDTPINFDPWYATVPGSGVGLVQSGTTPIAWDIWYLQGP